MRLPFLPVRYALEFDLVAYDLTTFTSKVSNKTMKTFHSSRSLLIKYLGMRQLAVLLVLLATVSHKPRSSTALVHSTHYCFTTGHPTPICMEVLTSVEYIVISCRPNIAFIKGFPMIIRIQGALKWLDSYVGEMLFKHSYIVNQRSLFKSPVM